MSTTLDALLRAGSPADEPEVARLAGLLRADGVHRGDAVCFRAPPLAATALLYRACWRLGAVAVPVHHRATDADAARIAAEVHPVAGPALDLTGHLADVEECAAKPDDLAVVLFTSGSAGTPKGVRLTHAALASKALTMRAVHGLTAADAVLMPAPLAHVSGLLNGVILPGALGMRAVFMERWDPDAALELIERERITYMVGPPTFFVDLMAAPSFSPERVASLRLVSCGGAGVTPAFVERAAATLGAVVKRTYGSTEAPTVTTSHAGDDPARAGSTDGRAVGDAELRVDPTTGELQVRGSEIFSGYTDPEATAKAFTVDGWYRTGDLATLDADGWLTITGRLSDVIIRAGENIAAAEVEAALEAHRAVAHAVVVGRPDDRLGEQVCAFVVADGPFDLDECRRWFEARGVARFKTPEHVEVVDAFPVLESGKPDRAALRARAATIGCPES